ncbi:MAG: glycosyltransferase family 2 protein [Candidatus Doudnabacteria bacterium]|nr:glycosyltransferase family 2 protein [Candidatus Doudnabacteria bacterium]
MPEIKPISLILVVHQEAETLERVITDFYGKVIAKIPGSEFIICEDGSTDGTKEILTRLRGPYGLTLDMREGKRGYTRAMRDGFALAKNPVIFFSDSDGQHDPNDFWKMYPLLESADMVIGWKTDRKDVWYRLLLTRVFNFLIRVYFRSRLHDINCGFRLMKKAVVDFILQKEWRLRHCINAEFTVKAAAAGFKITETPVAHSWRAVGESRGLPVKKLPQAVWHILREFPRIKRDAKVIRSRSL